MRYDAEALKEFSIQIMCRCGLSREESEIFSDSLIRADLRGISSHGLTRLTAYARRVELGLVSGHVTPEITRDGGGVIAVDGKNGMGAYVGRWTMDACVRRAREQGGCFAAVAHGNHFGYAAYFTEYAARQGMLGLAIANGPPAMPPTGGKTPLLGTNPLAVSLPTGDPDRPLTLDMATSAAARGKVTLAKKNGQSIPLGWGVDSQGNPTTDPEAVLSGGAMLPMGGPKGYAISLIIDVLCSCITGSGNGQTMGSFYDFTRTQNSGYCFAALDLSRMVEPEVWSQRIQALLDTMRACPRQPGVEAIQIPGQPEQEKQERNLREGIALSSAVEGELRALSERLQVPFPASLEG